GPSRPRRPPRGPPLRAAGGQAGPGRLRSPRAPAPIHRRLGGVIREPPKRRLIIAAALAWAAFAHAANAGPVGERHLKTMSPTAALRDAEHRPDLRVTVWYPAAAGSKEERIDIGPPDKPLFLVGAVASDASFADARRRPVILFSHGFGGTARMMGWFGTVMAAQGYIVVAVDHPGNNGIDPITVAGATLASERPGDLAVALARVRADPELGRRP